MFAYLIYAVNLYMLYPERLMMSYCN